MPIYTVNNKTFNIPDDKVEVFEKKYPDAYIEYHAEDKKYNIPLSAREGFLKKYPNATYSKQDAPSSPSVSVEPAQVADPIQPANPVEDVKQDYTPKYTPRTEEVKEIDMITGHKTEYATGFGQGFRQGIKGLGHGIQHFGGEVLNLFTGSTIDEEKALERIAELELDGIDIESAIAPLDKVQRQVYETTLSNGDVQLSGITDEQKQYAQMALEKDAINKTIREYIEKAGSLEEAKSMLAERANEETQGDKWIKQAAKGLADLKPTKGFGAWVGNLAPQMIPAAVSIGVGAVTKNPTLTKGVGMVGMGTMTVSTAGMSMNEAREAGATGLQTWAVGIADGAIEFLTEKIPFNRYTSRVLSGVKKDVGNELAEAVTNSPQARNELERLLQEANKRLGGKLFNGKNAKDFAGDIVAEGLSEFTAEALQTITPMIYENPEDYPTIGEILRNGWEGAKAGVFMGSVLGGASKTMEHYQQKNRRKEQGFVDVVEFETDDGHKIGESLGMTNKGVAVLTDGEVQYVIPEDIIYGHRFTFDEFDRAEIQMESDESYDNGYSMQEPQEMNDTNNNYQYHRSELARILGIEESDIESFLGEDPIATAVRMRQNGASNEEVQTVIDYLNAKATYDGMLQGVRDDIDGQIEQSNTLIDSYINKGTGMVHGAVLKEGEQLVYIVNGNAVAFEDGVIDNQNSSQTIIVKDAATGELRQISPSDIASLYDVQDPNEQKEVNAQRIRDDVADQALNKINGVVDFDMVNQIGNTIGITMVLTERGFDKEYIKTFLANAQIVENPDGTLTFTDGQNNVVVPKQEIQQKTDAANMERVAAINEGIKEERAALEGFNEGTEDATETIGNTPAETTTATPSPLIPKDESGNPVYEQADSETAWDALIEDAEGDEMMAGEVAKSMIADKEAELKKLEKTKIKEGKTPAEKMAALKERKAEVEKIKQDIEAWKKIAAVPMQRQIAQQERIRQEEAEAAAKRRADEESLLAERKEAERKEQELFNGIPDYTEDTPQNARTRGYRRVNGHFEQRQQPLQAVQGKETEVEFSNEVRPKGYYAVIDASQLQPSHIQGNRNPMHFLDEAQPKERNDNASIMSAQKIAGNIRPATITTGETAYVGTPTVNARGEVIQGNSRSDALKLMYGNHKNQGQIYKQYLIDNAEQFGLNPEDVANMENPVLVRMLDVSDEQAITLGQYVAQDTESGGVERIKPKNAVKKMGDDMRTFASILLDSADEDLSFAELLDSNGVKVLKWMNQKGYITDTQYSSAFDSRGNLTGDIKNDLRGIMYQSIFQGGSTRLEEMFNALPAKAQKAILATAHRDFSSPSSESMIKEIQSSIYAFYALMQDEQFAKAKDYKSACKAAEAWQKQYQMDDITGESYLPSEKFSNFALLLAQMYKGKRQSDIQGVFEELYDLIQGTKEDNLFEQADNTPRTLVQAIKETLNIDYNGQRRNNVLVGDNKTSQQGQRRSDRDSSDTERTESSERTDDDSGRTGGDSGRSENKGHLAEWQGGLGTSVEISDNEFDEDGLPFVMSSTGTTVFGEIKEETGLTPAPIKLSLGNSKYGLVHLEKRHGKQIIDAGFNSVEEFVEYVCKNYRRIGKGENSVGEENGTYLLQIEDNHNNTLYVELSTDGSYWGVNSGGVFRKGYGNNKKEVWSASEVQNKQSATDSTLRDEDKSDNPTTPNGNVPSTSDDKDTTNSPKVKGLEEENSQSLGEQIKAAEKEVNTSPTDKQKEAGNYKKGHVQVGTFNITIEQPKGSVRSGVDANGRKWETTMQNTYGYIRGTEGVDGDHIDVFLSDDIDGWNGSKVFVVDQYNEDGTFDEHKVMLGFNTIEDAESAYLANYEKGWEKKHKIVVSPIHTEEFEKWIASSHRKTKAFAEYKSVQSAGKEDRFSPIQGYSYEEIIETVSDEIKDILNDSGIEGVDVKEVWAHGSRMRGDAKDDSDLDIILFYEGDAREDGLFNAISESGLVIEGIKIDVNPIRVESQKDIDRYKEKSRQYDEEKMSKNAEKEGVKDPYYVEESLDNGDKRITHYNSRGEISTITTERNGNVISVDSYNEGILFEHTEYDGNGKATSVTRYDKQGKPVSTQQYVDGKIKTNSTETVSVSEKTDSKTIVEQSKKPSSKIEDFGEKIGGARKDVIRKYADKINLNGTTFGAMFPRPEIDKLIEAGLPVNKVAAVKAMFDNAKREFESKKKHYGKDKALQNAAFYAMYAQNVLTGNENNFDLSFNGFVFTEWGKAFMKANIALYQSVFDRLGVEYGKMDLSSYAIHPLTEDKKKKLNLKSLNEQNRKTQEEFAKRKGTEPPVYKDGDLINFVGNQHYNPKDQFETLEEAVDAMVERIANEVKVGEEVKYKAEIYWKLDALGRTDYSKIFVGVKVHGHGIVKLMEFKSSNEANSWIDEHDADFQQMAAAKIEQIKSDKSKPLPKYRIDNIYVRDNNGSIVRYDVYADFGKGIMRPLKSFDIPAKETSQERLRAQSEVYKNEVLPYMNSEEAKQSADEYARRIQQEKESKNRNYTTERKSRERVGRDWRNGKDATPDMFVDMDGNKSVFGFRAVEFGNYVTNKERQQFLNDIYDALMDMSDVLGVSPRALSLGGQLAIAVGARGKSSASGHYEPEKNVINLTKTSGYGILAHEWLHAFDRYFSNYNPSAIYVGGVQYATSEEYKDDMRQEVKDAFAALMDVIKKSDYYKRSMMLGEYWSSDKELAARALQDHIIRKLNERGQKNEFLSNLTATEDWDGEAENYPFPLGEESERIGEAIDNLFSVIDEKVDEKGNTVMYQKGELVMDAESEAFRRATERTMKQLESIGIDVEIVSDEQTETMLGNDVKFMSERRFSMLKKAASTINRWLSDNVRGKSFELHLPEHTRKLIKKAMGRDFDSHNITSNGIAHALKNHGETGTKLNERSIPIRKEDAELIPYIMTAPDRVEKAATDISGRESIRFYKELSNGYVVVVEKEYKNSPDDMETITMWAEKSSKATNAQQNAAPDTHVQNAILSTDVAKIQKDAETAILNDEKINFSRSAGIFYSNAKKAVLDIKQDKATPEQWLKMIEKNGGLKASEDRWLGLSDWLKTQQKRKNIDVQYAKEYDGEAKQIAHGIKEGDISSIDLAAVEMVKLVKDGDILIPIPSRTGKATTSLALANRIAELAGKGKVADVLTGKERESLYNIKKEGKELPKASELEFVLKNQDVLNGNNRVVFVDNVMGTGTTLEAAVELIPNATALVYAKDNSTLSDKKTLTKDEILNFINENSIQIEEVEYEENPSSFDELKDEYERLLREEGYDYAQEVMRDRYGDDFDIAFADMGGELVIDNEEAAATLLGSNNIINSTRLQYTTEGLDNKKEIALVVPTIESYNSHDEIHFGDAGDGRAVAWVRFGETTDSDGKRVLVIDEIQSKRHQDGREKGYRNDKVLTARLDALKESAAKVGMTFNADVRGRSLQFLDMEGNPIGTITRKPTDEQSEIMAQVRNVLFTNDGVPSAPFEKNWQELAMKRMLRYAAENGFDKVAWTTGEQQAERYSMTKFFSNIEREDNPYIEGRRFILYGGNHESLHVNEDGMIIESTIEETINKPLENIVGKDIAVKMMSLEDGDMLENEELSIGGEGMKGFYDNMLPAFVNKYGKKWGAKVGEVSLPKIGDDGLTMHSVDVTPQMKKDVMKGQPMFHKGQMSFDFLNQQDTPLSDTRLRKLEEGETSKIERIFTENKNFDFTSGEKIESIDDVAFIFKQLEDESIENSFAVLVKDGKPTVIHLGMGSYTATGLNGSALNVAVERIQPDKIYFIHNHPSGNLTASRQDIELLNRLKSTYGDIFEDGIIINLRSGKFATFNAEEKNIHDEKNIDNAVPVKVYSFNKQVFEKNYDPAETFKIRSSSDVAKFISSHRLGERPKLGILVCNNQLGVVGNVFTPYTKVTKENAKDIAKDIVYYTTSMGGTCAMMFGNANIYEVGSKRISQHVEDISTGSIKLMDYLNMQKDGSYWSASDEGVSFMRTSSGTIYGWTVDGKVYLTKDGINPNTPVHEYSHLWAEALMKNNPVLWSRIVNGLKDTPVWNEVMLDEEYSSIHHNDNLVASEVLSRLSGTENYRRTMEEAQREIESEKDIFAKAEKITIWERVKQALKDFWNWVVKTYGTNNITPEEAVNMTLKDFWNGVKPKGARSIEAASDIANAEEDDVLYRDEEYKTEKIFGGIWIEDKQEFAKFVSAVNNNYVFEEDGEGITYTDNHFYAYYWNIDGEPTPYIDVYLNAEESQDVVNEVSKEINHVRRGKGIKKYIDRAITRAGSSNGKNNGNHGNNTSIPHRAGNDKLGGNILRKGRYFDNPSLYVKTQRADRYNREVTNSTVSSSPAPAHRRQMVEHAENLAKRLHLDNIEIVNSVSGLEGKKKSAKGFYDPKTGKITIVIPNNTSIADIEKTLLHEAVAHYGLRQLFGEHFDTFLDNVYNNVDESIRKRIAELAIRKYNYDFRKATEEYLASLAESTNFENAQQSGWWQKVKDFFFDMLSKLGFKDFRGVTLTDNELRYVLWRSYENLKEKKNDNIFSQASDIAKQHELGVGDYAKAYKSDDDILFRSGNPSSYSRWLARDEYERLVKKGWFRTQESLQDSMLSLKEAMKIILKGKHIEDIDGYENAYIGENRLSSTNQAEAEAFARRLFKPMLQAVSKLAKNFEERVKLINYMMAKHGLERNEYMRQQALQNGEKADRDFAGLTALTGKKDVAVAEAEAKRMVDEYEQNHDTAELWDKVNAVSKAILKKSYDSGLMNKETFDRISSMYKFYIPLRGFDEKTSAEAYAYLTHKESAFNAPIKQAYGRKSKADDPFAYLQSMAESTIMQGNRNRLVKQRFLNFVLNHPSDLVSVSELWLEKDDVTGEWKPVFPDNIDANDSGEVVEQKMKDFEEKMENLYKQNPDKYKKKPDAKDVPYKVVTSKDLHHHQVVVKRNGRDIILTVNGNPRLAQALNGETNPDSDAGMFDKILKGGEYVNRYLSAAYTTHNPDFMVSNFLRDMLYTNTMVWIKESPNYALLFNKNYAMMNPAAMMVLYTKYRNGTLDANNPTERMFEQFIMNGGETGFTNLEDIKARKKKIARELRKMKKHSPEQLLSLLGERFEELNSSIENCARFAAFVTSREMGRSLDRSIYDAKEISVNFNKKGAGAKFLGENGQGIIGNAAATISGVGRSFFVFWNAAIQGTTNFGRQVKRHPVKTLSTMAAMFILGALMADLGDDDEDDVYYNQPEWVRRSNITFSIDKDDLITIPLPVEYRAIYGMGELASSVIRRREHLTDGEIAKAIAGQVSQILPIDFMEGSSSFIPSAAKPIVEAWNNRDWTGSPIYKEMTWNEYAPDWTKAYSNANRHLVKWTKDLNERSGGNDYVKGTFDFNPAVIEHVLEGYFGGYYKTADKLIKTAEIMSGKREYDPSIVMFDNRVHKRNTDRTEYGAVNREYKRLEKEYEFTKYQLNKYEKAIENGIFEYAERIDFLYNSPEYQRYQIFDQCKPFVKELEKVLKTEHDDAERKEVESALNKTKKMTIQEIDKTRQTRKGA